MSRTLVALVCQAAIIEIMKQRKYAKNALLVIRGSLRGRIVLSLA